MNNECLDHVIDALRAAIKANNTSDVEIATDVEGLVRMRGAGATAVAAPTSERHLVYVHGICKHVAGYSTPWWENLRSYGTTAFGPGQLGDTRLEVLWSDIIIPDSTASMMALAPAVGVNATERAQVSSDLRKELSARAAAHAVHSLARGPAVGLSASPAAAAELIPIPGIQCVEGFTYYLVNDAIRARIIRRFTDCLRPLLQLGGDIDIIAHSWGTVVAYEGLRQLADEGLTAPRVRNLFTVGAALSIGVVKSRLRPQNQDGVRPANVRRWVNLNAEGDIVGGAMKGYPYAVDFEYLNLAPFGCTALLNLFVSPSCAHGSYFAVGNAAVNRDIFTWFIDHDTSSGFDPPPAPNGGSPAAGVVTGPGPGPNGPGVWGLVGDQFAAGRSVLTQQPQSTTQPQTTLAADAEAVRSQIGQIVKLLDFRPRITKLTDPERELLIDQALLMLEQLYAHLPLKRAMYGIDPIQRLRLLRLTHQQLSEREFQSAMIEIFIGLRDLHTNYILPDEYGRKFAFLPFRIEEYYERGDESQRKYAITWVSPINTDARLKEGLIVTHWNGSPIENAIERNANREAGSNEEAHRAHGIDTLTLRWLGMSLPPDEDWVTLDCLDNQTQVELRFDWQVIDSGDRVALLAGLSSAAAPAPGKTHWGIDLKTAMVQRMRTLLFDPGAVKTQADMASRRREAARAGGVLSVQPAALSSTTQSVYPDIFTRAFVTDRFGYIRLKTFVPPQLATGDYDVDGAVNEFIRLLGLMPSGGLILDVRGNGGGIIAFGERLLQLMTTRPIQPELFYLLISQLGIAITKIEPWLNEWAASMAQGVQTGAAYSQGFPLTSVQECNNIGRKYAGPVVLITDALCYSTTDIFAAGFQDHQIGKILGVHKNTGAGGANVWDHGEVLETLALHPDPFVALPQGARMRVAARRSTRQGAYSGVPLENLGVVPNEIHYMTFRDVMENNDDLIAHAARMLAPSAEN